MRWIFFSLLAVNLVYFGWQIVNPREIDQGAATARAGSPVNQQIVLLKEVRDDDRNELKQMIKEPIFASSPSVGMESDLGLEEDRRRSELLNAGGCSAVGPFEDVFKAQQVSKQLVALDIGLRVRAVDRVEDEYDYRLLIPPFNSPEEAFRRLRELQASGIDSFVITAGEHALGISLGVYSSDAGAKSARARFAQDGIDTEKVQMTRLRRNYWLYHKKGLELIIEDDIWRNLTDKHPGIVIEVLPCE